MAASDDCNYSATSIGTDDLLPAYGIDFVVPFEVDVEVGTSFGHLTEAQFSEKGKLLNAQEIQSFIEDAQNCNFN